MKIIEAPVQQIETTQDLKEISIVIVALLKSLKSIYDNSNFYREARIVSFVDRLFNCILGKFKKKFSIQLSIIQGISDLEKYQKNLKLASGIVTKFLENYFVLDIIDKQNEKEAKANEEEEKKESERKKDEQVKKMSESFYQKEGLDFLHFNRPGTAYNNPEAFGKDSAAMKMMGTSTRFNFFDPSQQRKQSIESLAGKSAKSKSLIKVLWMERA